MDRGAWQAIVHGVTRVGHYLAAKPLRMELPKAGLLASKKDKVILREELFLRKFSGKRYISSQRRKSKYGNAACHVKGPTGRLGTKI